MHCGGNGNRHRSSDAPQSRWLSGRNTRAVVRGRDVNVVHGPARRNGRGLPSRLRSGLRAACIATGWRCLCNLASPQSRWLSGRNPRAVARGCDVNVIYGLARRNGRGFPPAVACGVHCGGNGNQASHFRISTVPMAIGTDIRALVGNIV